MAPGYRVPTALELAVKAEAIVIGTVEGEERQGDSSGDTTLRIRPDRLLKGAALPETVRMQGYLATRDMPATRSDPRELFRVNPDALSGGCNRYVFARGMRLVLFLVRDKDGALSPWLPSFARAAEDVPSDDALWVRAVRLYAEASAVPAKQRRAWLGARRAELLARGDAESVLLAEDITRQISKKRLPPMD